MLCGYLVTIRRVVLPLATVLVLGLGVYLFLQVRAQPAPPQITRTPQPTGEAVPVARPNLPDNSGATEPAAPSNLVPADALDLSGNAPVASDSPRITLQAAENGAAQDAGGSGQGSDAPLSGRRLDHLMRDANRSYDAGDFEQAKTIAGKVLAKDPNNIRMLRIMVSASCQDGDTASAQSNFPKLPPADQEQMRTRCARFGVTFP
jgi:hypothetical protein